jgi:hypothetical protein
MAISKVKKETEVATVDVTPEDIMTLRVQSEALTITGRAKELVIKSDPDFVAVGEFLKAIKGLQAEVDSAFDEIISLAHAAHKKALEKKKIAYVPLLAAEAVIKPKIAAWMNEQERIRREAQAKADREARLKAEQEAEAKRIRLAEELCEQGKLEEAEAVLEDTEIGYVEPERVVVQPTMSKVAGLSVRKTPIAELDDLKMLLNAIAAGNVPIQAIEANMVFLNGQAKLFKTTEALNYPGVRVVMKDITSCGR